MPSPGSVRARLNPDLPGEAPPKVSGKKEKAFFDKDAAAHEHAMRSLELGFIGRWIGGHGSAAMLTAILSVFGGFMLSAVALYGSIAHPDKDQVLIRMFDLSLGLIGTALGFVFGKGASHPRD